MKPPGYFPMLIGARSFDDSAAPAARVMNNRCMNNDEGSHVLNCMVNTGRRKLPRGGAAMGRGISRPRSGR